MKEKTLQDSISSLDDTAARRILATFAKAREGSGEFQTEWPPGLGEALRGEFAIEPAGERPSEGDLARQALLVLAEDPENREGITALIDGPPARSFDFGASLAVGAAALIVLQTRFSIQYKDGKWEFSALKKPTSDALLKPLVQKLIGFPGSR